MLKLTNLTNQLHVQYKELYHFLERYLLYQHLLNITGGRHGGDRMVVSTYHHYSCEFESHSWRGILYTTLGDKVYQRCAAGFLRILRFPPPIKLTAL